MKSILGLIVVLIIGFIIGNFTAKGGNIFSFVKSGMFNKNNTEDTSLINEAKDSLDEVIKSAQKETGAVFDKKYLDAMITAYESSVTLSKIGTVAGGQNEIRTLAKSISKDDAVTLTELKKIRDKYYPEDKTTSTTTKPDFVK